MLPSNLSFTRAFYHDRSIFNDVNQATFLIRYVIAKLKPWWVRKPLVIFHVQESVGGELMMLEKWALVTLIDEVRFYIYQEDEPLTDEQILAARNWKFIPFKDDEA